MREAIFESAATTGRLVDADPRCAASEPCHQPFNGTCGTTIRSIFCSRSVRNTRSYTSAIVNGGDNRVFALRLLERIIDKLREPGELMGY